MVPSLLCFTLCRGANIFFRGLLEFVAAGCETKVIGLALIYAGSGRFVAIDGHTAHRVLGLAVTVTMTAVLPVALSDADWPVSHPWFGGSIVVSLGLAYTGYTEWYSVYQAGYWGYKASMPLVFGIGLAPLLQWVFIPVCAVSIIRVRRTARQVAN